MPQVKKSEVKKPPAIRPKQAKAKSTVVLPKKRSKAAKKLREYSILVHGEKKIGKTTLFAQEKNAIFFEFDPPQKALEIYQVHIATWEDCLELLSQLEESGQFRTVILDGIDTGFQLCFDSVCARIGISHPQDVEDFGRSWGQIRKEFSSFIRRVLNIEDCSARFICHSQWKTLKTRTGGKIDKLLPILTGQAEECLIGPIDIWMAYAFDGDDRVMIIEGDEHTGAGHRVKHRFRTKSGNRKVREIHAGSSPEEAYRALVDAFTNQQEYATLAERARQKKGKKK